MCTLLFLATQSSLWSNDVAQLAIDGNRDANLADRSCSSTSEETNPWWRVDLLGRYSVTAVTVTNREDCCPTRIDGAEIHIGNSLDNNGIDNPRSVVTGQTYTFQCNEMEGRYVVLVIPGQAQYLTLCEVEVYGTASFSNNNQTRSELKDLTVLLYTAPEKIKRPQHLFSFLSKKVKKRKVLS
uniref:Fucolectin tachylectin-4 pentraxin-1 domain-containing protein n=1 Tax=Esox lucius TaxID=8010 RepID=A0A3P8ZTE8_ESOLU